MLLNPFLQLGKLRQRPLRLEPVVPRDSAAELVPAFALSRSPGPELGAPHPRPALSHTGAASWREVLGFDSAV